MLWIAGSDSTAKGKAVYGNNWDVAMVVALAVLALGPGCVLAEPPEWVCSILRAEGHGVTGAEGVGVNLCSGLEDVDWEWDEWDKCN